MEGHVAERDIVKKRRLGHGVEDVCSGGRGCEKNEVVNATKYIGNGTAESGVCFQIGPTTFRTYLLTAFVIGVIVAAALQKRVPDYLQTQWPTGDEY